MSEEIKSIIESRLIGKNKERQKEIAQRVKDICRCLDGLSVSEIEIVEEAIKLLRCDYSFFKF